jgi:hypothetical protein
MSSEIQLRSSGQITARIRDAVSSAKKGFSHLRKGFRRAAAAHPILAALVGLAALSGTWRVSTSAREAAMSGQLWQRKGRTFDRRLRDRFDGRSAASDLRAALGFKRHRSKRGALAAPGLGLIGAALLLGGGLSMLLVPRIRSYAGKMNGHSRAR